MSIMAWHFCHILPVSRDWICPFGAFSFHPFLLKVKQLFSQETFQQKACSFFWCRFIVLQRLHIAIPAVASGEIVWKERRWAFAEKGRKVSYRSVIVHNLLYCSTLVVSGLLISKLFRYALILVLSVGN